MVIKRNVEYEIFTIFKQCTAEEKEFLIANAKQIAQAKTEEQKQDILSIYVDDKEEIASFILDTDGAGVRYIAKTLNDPNELVKMVWYKLKGEEAFNQISEYYKQEIAKASRTNYTKGYEDAKAGRSANSSKTVVRKPASYTNKKKPLSIDELD